MPLSCRGCNSKVEQEKAMVKFKTNIRLAVRLSGRCLKMKEEHNLSFGNCSLPNRFSFVETKS